MVILRELDGDEWSSVKPPLPGSDWERQARTHFTRTDGSLDRSGYYSEIWGCQIVSSDSSDFNFTTMEVSSKFTTTESVECFRRAVMLSGSGDESGVITESVGAGELVTTVNTIEPHYFYMYTALISVLNLWFPFIAFEISMLKTLNVAPSKLHPNGWAFIKAFEIACLGFELEPSVGVFFSFYHIKSLTPNTLVSISSQPNRGRFNLFASNFKNYKDNFLRFHCGTQLPDLMFNELVKPLFPFYWTSNPRLIKGAISEKLSEFERETVAFLETFGLMDISELIKREGNKVALEEYLQRMRTISNEDRLRFLAKARQHKSQTEAEKVDPLSQLLVEDEAAKGGKRKKRTETGRITMSIPNKGEASAAGGNIEEVVPPSLKKHKGNTVTKGRTMALLPGPDNSSGGLDGDHIVPAAEAELNSAQPSSSQTAPAATSGDAPFL
ncbi:hypothetical protein A2U01_0000635 [Trifolium medium]|uniref:Uncharacterized protein n=1 Tax=Trifolium medium TaxID=97028 RepID=A0A392LZY5_9FABA|nr:hypothetical protein [Trifolium medium]